MTSTTTTSTPAGPESSSVSTTGLMPVSMSAAGLTAAAAPKGEDSVGGPDQDQIPQDGSSLANLQQESYQLEASFAAKLGFPVTTMSTDDKLEVMLYGLTRYRDVVHKRHTYRYGVAIRVLLEIYDNQLDGDLTLPVVAAKAQLGVVSASAQLLLYGYTGDLSDTLPNWQSFDVDSYADYLKSVSVLQGKVFGDPSKMRPVLLSSTLASTLKPAKGTTITRAGAIPAADVHQHRLRGLISKLEA